MGDDFVFDRIKPTVVTLKGMALQWMGAGHHFDDTAEEWRKSQ
jgi:hypothetical protein